MGDYNDAFMRGKDAAVQARTKAQNRATVLQLKLIGQSHPTGLTSNLLKLFEPRPPLEYKPPPEKRKCPPYSGIAQFVSGFAKPGEPKYAPPVVKGETPTQKRARIHKQRLEDGALKAATELQNYDPSKDPNLSGDPYKTLFVARLSYETTEHRIKRDFEVYGPIKRVRLVTDQNTNKPRGYAFIEYIHTRDMKTAYKQADGKKIDNRRVLVDVERGRTVPNWRPRRLGGGLGSTRIGGEGMNQKFSGREPQQITAGGARRSEEPRVREDRRDREVSRERGRDREREKSRERSHERGRDRDAREDQHHRDRDRNRDRDRERDRDRNRDHDRERDRDRDRSHRTRDHDRGRDRDRERDQDRDHERDRRRERERGYEHGEFDRDYERSREREDEYGKKVEPDHGYDGEFKQSEHNHDPVWYGHGERGEAYNLTEKDHSHEEGYEKGEIGRNGGELSRDREGEYNYADGPEYEQCFDNRLSMVVQWAGFDLLEFGPSAVMRVLLLAYTNGFQVLNVEDASNVHELVSKRDGPVKFLQMQPRPSNMEGDTGFRALQPLLLVVAGDASSDSGLAQGVISGGNVRVFNASSSTVVRFYSLRSYNYVHVLRFQSTVYLVRCSPRVIAIALAGKIYCFDAVTLENKFSVSTYPLSLLGQTVMGTNIGYGPMAVCSRWLSYASNEYLVSTSVRLSPQNLTPSSGVSPSTSPGNGSLMTRFAVESGKHLASGLINLGDIGYKTLSKYCQDVLPDSSVSSNGGTKLGRHASSAHSSENDNAGVVVVKDFVTNVTIAHFRAHASPISALCFDTSGTLLLTASVNGNSINVFRIMPSHVIGDQDTLCYDWSASHVHLYKLYRGMTSAVIQDICFSNYNQWIAITSSRGTCHIFALSPFGSEVASPSHVSCINGSSMNPPSPWRLSSGSCTLGIYPSQLPPPPPVTLFVVCRIKSSFGGWLNTVGNPLINSSAKKNAPSGVVAAVFHNSVQHIPLSVCSTPNPLEHFLVYSPSGYLMQHNLLPSSIMEPCGKNHLSGFGTGSVGLNEEEDIKVLAEPVQWWDVCRRISWPEREGNLSSTVSGKTRSKRNSGQFSDCSGISSLSSSRTMSNGVHFKDHKTGVDCHVHLSNAEVQINSGKVPLCQTSKICFHAFVPTMINGTRACYNDYGGEIEIEKIPLQEIGLSEQDLHPVIDRFHRTQSDKSFGSVGERYVSALSFDLYEAKMLPGAPIKDILSKELAVGITSGVSSHSLREEEGLFQVNSVNTVDCCSESSVASGLNPYYPNLELPLESGSADANAAVNIRQYLQEGYCKVLR